MEAIIHKMHTATGFELERRERNLRSKTGRSLAFFERAQQSLAGGVSSGLRRSARPYPLYFSGGQGPYITDVDGNTYADYGLAWGPLILGHAPPEIADAVAAQVRRGLTFGAQHELEYEVAERLKSMIPCADLVAFANSGTEAVQVALRLARAATGRRKFLKFEGHYHGWDDSVLVSYHPSAADIANANSVPIGAGAGQRPHDDVVIAEWNDRKGVERLFVVRRRRRAAAPRTRSQREDTRREALQPIRQEQGRQDPDGRISGRAAQELRQARRQPRREALVRGICLQGDRQVQHGWWPKGLAQRGRVRDDRPRSKAAQDMCLPGSRSGACAGAGGRQ